MGLIAQSSRVEVDSRDLSYPFIQTDRSFADGMLGSPIFSPDGYLLGLVHALDDKTRKIGKNIQRTILIEKYGYIIPVNRLIGFLYSIPEYRDYKITIQNGIHEIPMLSDKLIQDLGLGDRRGILVSFVDNPSPGHSAGIQRHDLILTVEGEPVLNRNSFFLLMKKYKSKETVRLEIIREGKGKKVDILR